MAAPDHDAEHSETYQPEADQAPAGGQPGTSSGSPEGSAGQDGTVRAAGRRFRVGMIAAGVALLTVTIAVLKVINPSLAVLPPVIREPAGVPVASGPAEPTPDLAAASIAPTASIAPRASTAASRTGPTAAPPLPLSYEAESADSEGVRARTVERASGGKVVGRLNRWDDHVTFVVTVPAAGRYTVTVYYIAGSTESQALVTVNYRAHTPARFAATGGWDTVKSLVLPVDLASGDNRIRFVHTGGGALDLDRITVTG